MENNEKNENKELIKDLFLEASDFTLNGHPVSVDELGTIHTFQITEGDFHNGKYKFTGIVSISIERLSQLYEFEGYATENEIIGSINIKRTH